MEGIIKIHDLRVSCVIGAYEHERLQKQQLSVDFELKTDFSACVQTDLFTDTVNYDEAIQLCKNLAYEREYHLLETYAYEALHALLEAFPISWARVRVTKRLGDSSAQLASVEVEKYK